jgi:hypothetical protein
MGKSIRSKGERINRANRRLLIHKPKEDLRLDRLTQKLADPAALKTHVGIILQEEPEEELVDDSAPITKEQRMELLLNRNQFKKKIRAKSKSRKAGLKITKVAKKFQ